MPARTDNVSDPALAAELLLARRGQAYFARKLNELPDDGFAEPSLVPGWSRAHVVAHVGYHARALAQLVEEVRCERSDGVPAFRPPRAEDIEFGATLPVEALRNLTAHAGVHLNVEWRDLPEEAWSRPVRLSPDQVVPVAATVWMRGRDVWTRAIDLRNGGTPEHFPRGLVDRLQAEPSAAERDAIPLSPSVSKE